MEDVIYWFIGQTVIIVLAIFGAFVRSRERLTKVETSVYHIQVNSDRQGKEIVDLATQVRGISRHVAQIEGKLA